MVLRIRDRSRPATPGYFTVKREGSGLLAWEKAAARFAAARNYWVSTASATGRPHAMPVWGVWLGSEGEAFGGTATRWRFATTP